jgi:hypothetical protein
MVQQIRKHGASGHMPGTDDALPWLGDYPFPGGSTANQGIHMMGLTENMPIPSLGTQTGADGAVAVSSTAFAAASGRFTTNDTGMTLTIVDTGATVPAVYTFTVTFVDTTHLTLGSSWAGTGTTGLSWSLTGRGPSNAGALYLATDGGGGGGTITAITSADDSITVTDPTGPTVDLSTFTPYAAWQTNGSAGSPPYCTVTAATTVALGSVLLNLQISGDTGLWSTSFMKPTDSGVYTLGAWLSAKETSSGDLGTHPYAQLFISIPTGGGSDVTGINIGTFLKDTTEGGDNWILETSAEATHWIDSTENFQDQRLRITNYDSVSHDFVVVFWVAKIGGDREAGTP